MRVGFIVGAAALFGLLAAAPARAQGPAPIPSAPPGAGSNAGPEGAVRALLAAIRSYATKGPPARGEVERLLDFEALSRFVLGPHWETVGAPRRAEFTNTLRQLLEIRAFPQAGEFFEDVEIEFVSTQKKGEATEVQTEVESAEEGLVTVDYRLVQVGGAWRVEDVVLDAVSLRINLRSRVQKLIAEQGWDALMKDMKKKLADPDESLE